MTLIAWQAREMGSALGPGRSIFLLINDTLHMDVEFRRHYPMPMAEYGQPMRSGCSPGANNPWKPIPSPALHLVNRRSQLASEWLP